jgi:hypothetical protein
VDVFETDALAELTRPGTEVVVGGAGSVACTGVAGAVVGRTELAGCTVVDTVLAGPNL